MVQVGTAGQYDIDGKLVALGTRHQSLGYQRHQQATRNNAGQSYGHRHLLVAETGFYHPVVAFLQSVEHRSLFLTF